MNTNLKNQPCNRKIDVRGAICPHPVSLVKDALSELGHNQTIEVMIDHVPAVKETIPRYCQNMKYPIEILLEDEGYWRIFVKKIQRDLLPKLRLKGVTKLFSGDGGVNTIIDNVNLEIEEGEFFCLVGPSGSGKSTLLNLITGIEKPDIGEVYANGQKVTGQGIDRILVFQELGLFPWLTVIQNVEFGMKIAKMKKEIRRELAMDFLKMVHLTRYKDAYVYQLSGGMKQRVALARAFALNPDILLMDEPFAALDSQTRDVLHEELQRIWSETKKTIIFVTHNVREAVCLGDRVAVLSSHPGRIKSEFKIDFKRPRHIEDPGLMNIVRPILGDLKVEVDKIMKREIGNGQNN